MSSKKTGPVTLLIVFLTIISAALSCNSEKQQTKPQQLTDTSRLAATYQQLIDSATKVRTHAYAPYSKFLAGAAVLAGSGAIYTGCNVENASYGLTNCAERTAIFNAVAAGEKTIKAIAIVFDVPDFDAPCGACRQVIYEFGKDIDVIMSNLSGKRKTEKITTLLPYAFGPESL
ncbi:MAG: cytidine deaminase [Chitinophagaceae bacterium]|nr:cytidine deaminase [Chitinophagaceae bacterium]